MDRPDSGSAGESARRVHERRRTAREERIRERHPRIGSALLRVRGAPQGERNWSHGAEAEEMVADHLERHCHDAVLLLHDRRLPGSRANIDHIAVAPSGVWVIDTKRYKGAIRVRSPLIGPAELRIGGRNRTKLVEALDRYRTAVAGIVEEIRPEVPVHGVFCFVEGNLPLFGTPHVNGCRLMHRRSLAKGLNRRGPLSAQDTLALASELALRFPPV